VAVQLESLVDAARTASGLGTVYRALDELVDLYALDDAAVVVDVPELGRQVLHAGRRPLHDDEHALHAAAPGLYLWPALDDPVLAGLMVALGTLAFRHDTATTTGSTGERSGP
jgi:D-serine deaminase-like pyridoxal phosphate-dependent protein